MKNHLESHYQRRSYSSINKQTKVTFHRKTVSTSHTIRKKLHYRVCSGDIDARPLLAEAAGKLQKLQNTECPEESNIRSWARIVRTIGKWSFGLV